MATRQLHSVRVRKALAESLRRFGEQPDPVAILTAIVDSAPGVTFREWIDPLVIEFAAGRAIGRTVDPR